MNLNDLNQATIDLSSVLYETIKKALTSDKGYRLTENPIKTTNKAAIVRAAILADDQPDNGLIRVNLYFDEIDDVKRG